MRENRTQQALAVTFDISQPTVSRILTHDVPLLAHLVSVWIPTWNDIMDTYGFLIVDGALITCTNTHTRKDLYSGKHHTTGYNLQIACDVDGHLVWTSNPQPGSMHDTAALRASGFITHTHNMRIMADKGYIGLGFITPMKKPPG
ncbi:Transposase DDE domain protein [Corynebacterium oculi]|uniref:Transposase DDE domain protein n=1 Tax=Corynebacterium oculi TaxID=1544416 RepID=A0A0Q1AFR9_9CORY|nr:Transposase DDE domain protein [Corynebacterium oculi]